MEVRRFISKMKNMTEVHEEPLLNRIYNYLSYKIRQNTKYKPIKSTDVELSKMVPIKYIKLPIIGLISDLQINAFLFSILLIVFNYKEKIPKILYVYLKSNYTFT